MVKLECWRTSKFPDYEVSDHGRVRRKTAAPRTKPGRILKGTLYHKKLYVDLSCRGQRVLVRVDELVSATFLGVCPDHFNLIHINTKATDNTLSNLVYEPTPNCYGIDESAKEIWKILSRKNGYEASNLGRIRRWANDDHYEIVCPWSNKNGYLSVYVGKKRVFVHRLVAKAFLGSCPRNKEINHRDGIQWNNRINNLEYTTHKENSLHASRMEFLANRNVAKGEQQGSAKLSAKDIPEIRALRKKGMKLKDIARRFGVHLSNVSLIAMHKAWKHI